MAATNTTGVGPGDSKGKQKPRNHYTCGCFGDCGEEKKDQPKKIISCKISYNTGSRVIKHSSRNGSFKLSVCS